MPSATPKLIIHYRPENSRAFYSVYCGIERRSTSVPATSSDVNAVDCLTCLRAYHVMWGGAAERIAEVKRARARTSELLGGKP